MGNAGAVAFGLEKAQITLEESIPGMVDVVCTRPLFVVFIASVCVFACVCISCNPHLPGPLLPLLMDMSPEKRGVGDTP